MASQHPTSSATSSKREVWGPERRAGQGLGAEQAESGNRAIHALLCDDAVANQVDLIATWREDSNEPGGGAYEVWARRGMVRFRRVLAESGGLDFEVVEVVGENPLANQSPHALRTVVEEGRAAAASGHSAEHGDRRFIASSEQSYPFGYERVAQLFDSPNAPDLALSPEDWAFGTQPGQHGALNVRQSRAPLWFSGPGVRVGVHDLAARAIDIAPTVLAALGFPHVDGADATGRRASERGCAPDVRLARQDGRELEEILDSSAKTPQRLYIFILDGMHPSELEDRLERDPKGLPHLRRLRERAAVLGSGSIVNFPSITWPSHTAIGTGAWCGHHDVVNPSYYVRAQREMVSPQGQQVNTEHFSNSHVESLYEAFRRVRGDDAFSAAIHAPFGRGADHAVLEGRNTGDRERLKALTREVASDCDPRWVEDGMDDAARESRLDQRGVAQVIELLTREGSPAPDFIYHELALTDGVGHDYGPHSEGLAAALDESDRRIGRVLDLMEKQGLCEDTLFVVTGDHGMAPQDTSLRANPAQYVSAIGMAASIAEPMVWLHDLAVEVERAADRRTGRVLVFENDADASGERPPREGAHVRVVVGEGDDARVVASGATGVSGVFGFATPAEIDSEALWVEVEAEGFNRRHLTLDGRVDAIDLRAALYAKSETPAGT